MSNSSDRRILLMVVGFGPFQDNGRNPSGELAEALDGRAFHGVQLIGRRVSVAWTGTWEFVHREVEHYGPTALLGLGIAPDPFIRLESTARNVVVPEQDEVGEFFSTNPVAPIVSDAPATYVSTLPLDWIKRSFDLRRSQPGHSMEAKSWHHAGYFLCNYLFFNSMHHLGTELDACGFIHIPRLPHPGEVGRPDESEILGATEFLVESLSRWLVDPSLGNSRIMSRVGLEGGLKNTSRS